MEAWITVSVILSAIIVMVFTRWATEWIMLCALVVLTLPGIVPIEKAATGFGNPGMLTVGFLFVVAGGLRQTGAFDVLTERLLGRPGNTLQAQARLIGPVAVASALMNNTPLVATMLPYTRDWARRMNLSVSHLMLPLSYAAILGGACTLIGTSTNLVVYGLAPAEVRDEIGLFEIAWLGVPVLMVGLIYILIFGRVLLKDRHPADMITEDTKQYAVEMIVQSDSPMIEKTIEQAGLRHLAGMYLFEINRHGHVMPAVGSDETIYAGDRLVFVGVVDSVVDLRRIKGLVPAENQVFKLDTASHERRLVEAVVSERNPFIGKTIREGKFRTVYEAAIIAVSRNGERLQGKIGDVVLRAGDVLLMESSNVFAERQRVRQDFHLVSLVKNSAPLRRDRMGIAWLAIGMVVLLPLLFSVPMLAAAIVAAVIVLIGRCVTADQALRSVDWSVLLVIAAAFGLSAAMVETGADQAIAKGMLYLEGGSPYVALAVIFSVTVILSNVITNNAAAALMTPIALGLAKSMQVNPMPLLMTLMVASSCGLATPISYQTNLMVYGPGGYRFMDYLKFGGPLTVLVGIVTVGLAPLIWGF